MGTGYGPVTTEAAWKKPDFVDSFLANQLSLGSISLAIGAGASMGFNLPSWDILVERMFLEVGEPLPTKSLAAPDRSEFLKSKVFRQKPLEFADLVRKCLYKDVPGDLSLVLSSRLLQAISSFLVSSMRGRAGSLISFNFDNLIETYLRIQGFVVRSETVAPYWTVNADMQVLHPHGMLPLDHSDPCTNIIFAASDYDRVIGRELDSWNLGMSSILVGTTPVFIGLSGDDQRMRIVFNGVKARHPAIVHENHRYWGVRPTIAGEDPVNVQRWREMGIAPRELPGYDSIPRWLLSICQLAAKSVVR